MARFHWPSGAAISVCLYLSSVHFIECVRVRMSHELKLECARRTLCKLNIETMSNTLPVDMYLCIATQCRYFFVPAFVWVSEFWPSSKRMPLPKYPSNERPCAVWIEVKKSTQWRMVCAFYCGSSASQLSSHFVWDILMAFAPFRRDSMRAAFCLRVPNPSGWMSLTQFHVMHEKPHR